MLTIKLSTDFKKVLIYFVLYKVLVLSVGFSAQFIFAAETVHTQHITDNIFLNPWAQYDSTAYLDIAKNGYTSSFGSEGKPNYHWYPLYPLTIRVFSFIGYDLAAFLISNIASFFVVFFLYKLVIEQFGARIARRSVLFLLFFPTSYYLTTMYTEALFLTFAIGMFYFSLKDKWLYVGVLGFLISLTRMQGLIMLIPIGYVYFRKIKFDIKKIRPDFLYLGLIIVGFLTFMAYDYLIVGDPIIQFSSASSWSKSLAPPWESFVFTFKALTSDTTLINMSYHIFNLFLVALFVILIVYTFKYLKLEYGIYFLINFLIVIFSSSLFGLPRYLLVVFPAFVVLALLYEKKKYAKYWIGLIYVMFVLLLVGLVILHVTQRVSLPILYTPLL